LVCLVLVGWFIYVYLQQKYCHLYLCKVVDYTDITLDDCAMYFWGVPLSMIASASALWGHKLGLWGIWCVPLSFVFSLGLYVALVYQVIERVSHHRKTVKRENYEELAERHGCDWFNTNPIHVLRSQYLTADDDDVEPVVYYQHGKQYQLGYGIWEEMTARVEHDVHGRLLREAKWITGTGEYVM
jgi:hypothetical protein